jgi:hypothetical protein
MFYRELAEKFDELFILSDIIDRLLSTDKPLKELKQENFVALEVDRIKSATYKALNIFGSEFDKYYYFHVHKVNNLTIIVIQKIKELSDKMYWDEREQYQLSNFEKIRPWLEKLITFYTAIDLSTIK